MTSITIKGHTFVPVHIRDSHNRKAVQLQNKIADVLSRLGLTEDDFDIPMEKVAMKRAPASVSWWFEGYHLHYSYNHSSFVDNLAVVFKILELEIASLLEERKTLNDFIHEFAEDKDIAEQRIEARKILGLPEDTRDIELINKTFKIMAREAHPDMPTGDTERFKALNRAHKILKRELG